MVLAAKPGPLLASDGLEPISVSIQSFARGGADVAVGDTALSQIDNPATLTLMPRTGPQLDTAAKAAFLDLHWRGPIDSADTDRPFVALANTGISFPVNERFTLGTALHSKAGLVTSYSARHLLIPFLKRHIASDLKVFSVPLNAAYRVDDNLSLGAGVRLEYATARFESVLGPAALEFGRGETIGGGFNLGLLYRPREDLTFGLAYRSPTWFGDLDGGRGKVSLLGLLPVPLGGVDIEDLRLPQKVTAGVAWDATARLKLVGEARWLNYRNTNLNDATIGTHGLLDLRVPFPLGYKDVWAFMAGAQYQLDEHWKVAAGYHYSTLAVPPTHLAPIGSLLSRHHVTTGLWYETKRWWVGGGYAYVFPESLRGTGCSCIPLAVDYGLSSLTQSQHAIGVGFGWRW